MSRKKSNIEREIKVGDVIECFRFSPTLGDPEDGAWFPAMVISFGIDFFDGLVTLNVKFIDFEAGRKNHPEVTYTFEEVDCIRKLKTIVAQTKLSAICPLCGWRAMPLFNSVECERNGCKNYVPMQSDKVEYMYFQKKDLLF